MKRLFDIVTLSSSHRRLADPITIITGGLGVLTQLFPNIFGGGRKRLTDADWLELLPGSGYWTTALRNYLKATIHYDNNLENMQQFTKNFVYERPGEICGVTGWNGSDFMQCYSKFLKILQTEKNTGGNSPVGITPGGYGQTIDYSTLMPLAIGAVALILVMKSKKRKK